MIPRSHGVVLVLFLANHEEGGLGGVEAGLPGSKTKGNYCREKEIPHTEEESEQAQTCLTTVRDCEVVVLGF